MARAILYKWINDHHHINQDELDVLIDQYPFAQNLNILKALSDVTEKNKTIGLTHSISAPWYQHVLIDDIREVNHVSAIPVLGIAPMQSDKTIITDTLPKVEITEEVCPTHVSDAEHPSETTPESKLLMYDAPWPSDEIVEAVKIDWTSSETIIIDENAAEKLIVDPIDQESELTDLPSIDLKKEIVTEWVEARNSDDGLGEKNLGHNNPPVSIRDDDNSGTTSISGFIIWLALQKETSPPASEPSGGKKRLSDPIQDLDVDLDYTKIITPNPSAESIEKSQDHSGSGESDHPKKKTPKKKKKKVKAKSAKKNKKLAQKLRKKKKAKKVKAKKKKIRKAEKAKLAKKKRQAKKDKKAKKAAKLALIKKKARKSRKKRKASEKSIEKILKLKASKSQRKKKKRKSARLAGPDYNDTSVRKNQRNKKVAFDLRLASEPLANLLWLQGHDKKAIRMFEDLSLKMPEKKAYFAAQIAKLKKKK